MGLKVVGLDKLQAQLIKNTQMNEVRQIVRSSGANLQEKVMRKAPYKTGTLMRSIGLEIKDGGLTAEVKPSVNYAPYLEYGTRFMEARPFIKPSLEEEGVIFKQKLRKLIE